MTNSNIQKILALTCILVLGGLLIILEPVSLPATLDFSQLYLSLQRANDGRALYHLDNELIEYNSQHSEIRGAFPFAGPPWYIALFLPLGYLSPEKAAFTWAILNVLFLSLTVALINSRYSTRGLGIFITIALLAAPVQGHLIVGQFSMIVGLGIALTIWASRQDRHALVAVGLALTTLRPHLGIPFVAAFLMWSLLESRSRFFKRGILFLALSALLITASLWLDSTSITSYPGYLTTLNSLAVNKVCDTCSSIPIFATYQQTIAGQDVWRVRFVLSVVFGAILIAPLLTVRTNAALFASSTVFAILLAAPYLRNYDYVLLIPALLVSLQSTPQLKSGSVRRNVYSLIFLASVVAGVLPYLTDRSSQGSYLWLSPLFGYMASALLIKELNPKA